MKTGSLQWSTTGICVMSFQKGGGRWPRDPKRGKTLVGEQHVLGTEKCTAGRFLDKRKGQRAGVLKNVNQWLKWPPTNRQQLPSAEHQTLSSNRPRSGPLQGVLRYHMNAPEQYVQLQKTFCLRCSSASMCYR